MNTEERYQLKVTRLKDDNLKLRQRVSAIEAFLSESPHAAHWEIFRNRGKE